MAILRFHIDHVVWQLGGRVVVGLVGEGSGAEADGRRPAALEPPRAVPRHPPVGVLLLVAVGVP